MRPLQVSDPLLMQHQARGLESFQKVFGVRKDLAAPAVGRCAWRQATQAGWDSRFNGVGLLLACIQVNCACSAAFGWLSTACRLSKQSSYPCLESQPCRVFDILVNNLPLSEPGQQPPPGKPPPIWREGMHARQFTASEALGC